MYTNTSGYGNIAIGAQVLQQNTTGYENLVMGYNTMRLNTIGYRNISLGDALRNNISGSSNIAFGFSALLNNSVGSSNIAFGADAGINATGSNNIFIGEGSGYDVAGSNNIFIGQYSGSYESGSNTFYLDNRDRGSSANDKAGALFYGTFNATPTSQTLQVNVGKFTIPKAPTASANYGLVSLVSGAFDGSTSGFFTGSANGTLIAGNLASASTSDLLTLQIAGTDYFKVYNSGNVKFKGTTSSTYFYIASSNRIFIDSIKATGNNSSLALQGNNSSAWSDTTGTGNVLIGNVGAVTQVTSTSGSTNGNIVSYDFVPTSGTAVFNSKQINGIINQTGGANGIVRGNLLAPTLTAYTDYRGYAMATTSTFSGAVSPILTGLDIRNTINHTASVTGSTYTDLFINDVETSLTGTTHNFADWQISGTSKFKVSRTGTVTIAAGAGYGLIGSPNTGLFPTAYGFDLYGNLAPAANTSYFSIYGRSSTATTGTVYGIDLGGISTSSTGLTFAAGAGSGLFKPLSINYTINNSGAQSGTATGIFLNATETALNSMAHNLMDLQIGGTSKFKVTNGGLVTISSTLNASGDVNAGIAQGLGITSRVYMNSSATGILTLLNWAANDWSRLNFGGTTSSFPALKRNATGLDVRLADDSAYAPITASIGTFTNTINTANAITATANAATIPVTSGNNIVTNNSAATLTITLTTTNAVNMQKVTVQILDFSAVAQTITWVNTENSTVTAPTTSNGSTTLPLTVGFIYNSATSKWRCVASA